MGFAALNPSYGCRIVSAAITMAIFYALAGGKHVMNAQRTASENWALWSDM